LFEKFNGPARRALQLAFREARRRQHDFLGTEHLLLGLLCDQGSASVAALRGLMLTPEAIQGRLEDVLHAEETGAALERFPLSPALQRALRGAAEEAGQLGRAVIGPEHLLLGLLREEDSQAALILAQFGLALENARRFVREQPAAEKLEFMLQSGPRPGAGPSEPTSEELLALVAPSVPAGSPAEDNGRVDDTDLPMPNIATPLLADSARYAAELENQLRRTQLALGAALGFYFGLTIDGWYLGILGALAGICLALLRSSFAGAWMGLMAGCAFLPRFLQDEERGISFKERLVYGLMGALVGSFLGDFWRRPQPPSEPTRSHSSEPDS
jgi:hypothetical protein